MTLPYEIVRAVLVGEVFAFLFLIAPVPPKWYTQTHLKATLRRELDFQIRVVCQSPLYFISCFCAHFNSLFRYEYFEQKTRFPGLPRLLFYMKMK